jgi:hypothetical protein
MSLLAVIKTMVEVRIYLMNDSIPCISSIVDNNMDFSTAKFGGLHHQVADVFRI